MDEEPKKLAPAEFKMGGAGFNPNSGAFIPKGKQVIVASDKEQFPDLDFDDAPKKMGKGKKGKKKGKMVVSQASEPVVDEEADVPPFFGKNNSDFFNMK